MFTLHNGDCLEYMKTLAPASVDCVITDPPYGVMKDLAPVFRPNMSSLVRDVGWDDYSDEELYNLAFFLASESIRFCKDGATTYFFCSEDSAYIIKKAYMKAGWHWRMLNIWHKTNPAPVVAGANRPQKATEGIGMATLGKRNTWNVENGGKCHNVFDYPIVDPSNRVHPTQKPVALMAELIERSSNPEMVIFDPFMGSGSTGVASVESNRHFIGCELSPEYFAIAERRIKESVFQPSLFTPSNNRVQRTGGESAANLSLFPAEVESPAKVTRQSTRR